MNTHEIFRQAELALASYSALSPGEPDQANLRDKGNGLSSQQAKDFAATHTVLTQYTDTLAEGGLGTSFSATVFKDGTGNLTLAIRGTAELTGSSNDLTTDADIALAGAGYDQIVAMANWWARETGVAGTPVAQYRLVPTSSDPNAVLLNGKYLEPAGTVAATGNLRIAIAADADHKLDITGHSLGGHLSMAFSTLFPAYTAQVTVFNAPGFTTSSTNQAFFAALGGSVPTGGSNITNVIADESSIGSTPWSAIAGLHSRPGVLPQLLRSTGKTGQKRNGPRLCQCGTATSPANHDGIRLAA